MTPEEKIILLRLIEMQEKILGIEDIFLSDISKIYAKTIDLLIKRISKTKGKWTKKRLDSLLDEINIFIEQINIRLDANIAEITSDIGVYSYQQINRITSWDGLVENFNFVTLQKAQILQLITEQKLAGKKLSDWTGDLFKGNLPFIEEEIRKGFIAGESNAKIASRIGKVLNDKQLKRHIDTIVRTYIQSINVKAQMDVFEANQDVVKYVEWSALMENRNHKTGRGTCPRCQALDGLRWKTNDKNRPTCPLHADCRCIYQPVTLSWKELGFNVDEMEDIYKPWVERDLEGDSSILKYGFTGKNYPDWWKTRSKQFQDNSVGPVRADLIRRGLIDFRDIIDLRSGELFTIKELIKKHKLNMEN